VGPDGPAMLAFTIDGTSVGTRNTRLAAVRPAVAGLAAQAAAPEGCARPRGRRGRRRAGLPLRFGPRRPIPRDTQDVARSSASSRRAGPPAATAVPPDAARPALPVTPSVRPPATRPCGGSAWAWRTLARWLAWLPLWWLVAAWTGPASAAPAGPAAPLRLGLAPAELQAWPAVRVLHDASGRLEAAQVLARLAEFRAPTGPQANLGPHPGAVWLHLALQVEALPASPWLLRVNYPVLQSVRILLFDARGTLLHDDLTGTLVPHARRSQQTRAFTSALPLQAGGSYQLLVRVATPTALLVPLSLIQAGELGVQESAEQALQGLMSGLWLFMAANSLVGWLHRRQGIYLAYAGTLLGSWLFSATLYGLGPQYLWPGSAWPSVHLPTVAPLLMVAANAQFFIAALDMRARAPRTARLLDATTVAAVVAAGLFAAGLVGYRLSSASAMTLTLLHLGLALPVAFARLREGDHAALYLLVGWSINVGGILVLSALLLGHLPVGFWTLHLTQLCFAIEMVNWLMVLAERQEQARGVAEAARRERDLLEALAHTDPLTGLPNRRGLVRVLEHRLADERRAAAAGTGASPALGVYLLDLDGFKPVNDRWGHEAGDELLRQVAGRLQAALPRGDVVARLGGDEFVAVVALRGAADAGPAGEALLGAFTAPFDLGERREVRLGATVGYALASAGGPDATALLRRADEAMYAGKQAGKRQVRRFT